MDKTQKAIAALKKAGMAEPQAAKYVRALDLDQPLKAQIVELAEDMPDLFGLDTDTEDDEPMSAREAQLSRLRGRHVLAPERGSEGSSAQRNAAAVTPRRTPRRSTAPATAQAAAARLLRGVGKAADRAAPLD
ncbi:hypothetical protein [Kitasatospora sp. NPDC051914]|uniref:hypothetical protein n=1 Tax=Kitasatospora sp. NPDC051914 TaxID=3154945 RepID=UPI00344639DB